MLGSRLNQFSLSCGTVLDHGWTAVGSFSGQCRIIVGPHVGSMFVQFGYKYGSMLDQRLDLSWTILGSVLDHGWFNVGPCLDQLLDHV